jgi:hypothetical protein
MKSPPHEQQYKGVGSLSTLFAGAARPEKELGLETTLPCAGTCVI